MTMMRDYKMYTYEVGYTYTSYVRDDHGESTGESHDAAAAFKPVVVARNQTIADAWVRERFDADHMDHREFEMRLIDKQPAPHLILEVPY